MVYMQREDDVAEDGGVAVDKGDEGGDDKVGVGLAVRAVERARDDAPVLEEALSQSRGQNRALHLLPVAPDVGGEALEREDGVRVGEDPQRRDRVVRRPRRRRFRGGWAVGGPVFVVDEDGAAEECFVVVEVFRIGLERLSVRVVHRRAPPHRRRVVLKLGGHALEPDGLLLQGEFSGHEKRQVRLGVVVVVRLFVAVSRLLLLTLHERPERRRLEG
mmetsp:Transcript_1421/g.4316  ORF Transcript_1421/g.4316 Transcript_1421/m.4316 type:complete len:217 (+) Transcript_1421:379-1029(+)